MGGGLTHTWIILFYIIFIETMMTAEFKAFTVTLIKNLNNILLVVFKAIIPKIVN